MRIEAPGKVVVLGEYAVLDGGPAVVVAVDRGVACDVSPASERTIVAPDDRFVRAALDAVHAPPATYRFSDWNPVDAPVKVGLGGSAAATVAAVLAGRPEGAIDERFRTALQVHRAVQGSGSGIDVAASTYGGVLRYQAERVAPLPALWPSVVFSGVSAATGPRVERYLAWGQREAFVAGSQAVVDGFAADPIPAVREAARLLRDMADAAGFVYWTAAIDRIVAAAEAQHGAGKPSGAGGGDIVVALFERDADQQAFEAACRADGFLVVPVRTAGGARITVGS